MNKQEQLKEVIVIDLETTGLNKYGADEILQVSIIDEYGDTLINEYCKPKHLNSWEESEEIHNITPVMVKDKKYFEEYADTIRNILDNAERIVIYNAEFELMFLKKYDIKIDRAKVYDLMVEFSKIYDEWNDYHKSYKFQSLESCCYHYSYKEFDAHNSLEDCKATLYCYNKLIKTELQKQIKSLEETNSELEESKLKKENNKLIKKVAKLKEELKSEKYNVKSLEKKITRMNCKKLIIADNDSFKKDIEIFNDYGFYTADYCKSTRKPLFTSSTYSAFSDKLLSKSRCKQIKRPVTEKEEIYGFYKVKNGYCALYYRD